MAQPHRMNNRLLAQMQMASALQALHRTPEQGMACHAVKFPKESVLAEKQATGIMMQPACMTASTAQDDCPQVHLKLQERTLSPRTCIPGFCGAMHSLPCTSIHFLIAAIVQLNYMTAFANAAIPFCTATALTTTSMGSARLQERLRMTRCRTTQSATLPEQHQQALRPAK